jgi:hypothetical protein
MVVSRIATTPAALRIMRMVLGQFCLHLDGILSACVDKEDTSQVYTT